MSSKSIHLTIAAFAFLALLLPGCCPPFCPPPPLRPPPPPPPGYSLEQAPNPISQAAEEVPANRGLDSRAAEVEVAS
jgi:hypothetical protein